MKNLNSVHLQFFPDVSKLDFDDVLVDEMDLVREVCSTALFIRDKENLRVRLPLNQIRIIGKDTMNLSKYKDIIADEVNVKSVIFKENVDELADFIIEVDMKKIGAKFGDKMKNILKATQENKWKDLGDGKIEIAGIELENGEYTIKLKPKDKNANNIYSLSNNKALVELDIQITPELELEGLARDLIRLIQQYRKEAGLDISDRINLSIKTTSSQVKKSLSNNAEYVKNQTLTKKLSLVDNISEEFSFGTDVNGEWVGIGFSKFIG